MRVTAAAVVLATLVLAGCASSGGGEEYRGVRLYEKGEGVYVCRDSHTAETREELAEKLREGDPVEDSPTGQSVRIERRDTVQVDGRSTRVALVEAASGSESYWIRYTALCSRDGSSG